MEKSIEPNFAEKIIKMNDFESRLDGIKRSYEKLLAQENSKILPGNGIFSRYQHPVITAGHTPIFWRYDLNPTTNPFLMERFGINATFNSGALKFNGRYVLVVRVEGSDRKSFFAIAESDSGTEQFRFRNFPVELPELDDPDINVYDMRLTEHQDGWIYGIFCTERKDPDAPAGDQSMAVASAGIVRTRDLITWHRLPDLHSEHQQRNVVLHPEFVDGKYAFYTRPQDGFIEAGSGGAIGWSLIDHIENPVIRNEKIIDPRQYHTIKELKNGEGPPPIKTPKGWLHLAHAVRGCAAGLRYVLYLYLTALDDPSRVIARPSGYFIAPESHERTGDVSNVVFSNGWIADDDGTVYIYYASSDTRLHVATSSIERLLDYCLNTPEDGLRSATSVQRLNAIIRNNLDYTGQ